MRYALVDRHIQSPFRILNRFDSESEARLASKAISLVSPDANLEVLPITSIHGFEVVLDPQCHPDRWYLIQSSK